MKMLLIDHFDSFTYNLKALFELNGVQVEVVRADSWRQAEGFDALLFSPGPSSPKNAGASLRYFDTYHRQMPIFGVCLGLQVIGYQLGYTVKVSQRIMHGRLDTIQVKAESELLCGLGTSFQAVRYHSLVVEAPEPYVTAYAQEDGAVMAFEDTSKGLYGVQFHPESLLSEGGATIILNFQKCVEKFYNGKKNG